MFLTTINRWLNNVQYCALCGAQDNHLHGVCEDCHADLPWLIHACPCCALPLAHHESGLCHHCRRQRPAFHQVHAAFTYSFPLSALIPRIKYQRQPAHIGWLAAVLANFIEQRHQGPWPDALIPVPMHPLSQIRRGYNQAALLADRLGRRLGIPVCHNLRKYRWTPKQMSLSLEARHQNLHQAFKTLGYPGDHVALVDDVMTTGTTVTTLTELLLQRGCRRVDVWVLARTPESH